MTAIHFLPPGKKAAVVFTIDDIHPGKSIDAYEAGGDLERGALGHLLWLLNRHSQTKVTLFTTPDWRQTSPVPVGFIPTDPAVRDAMYLAPVLPEGTMDVRNHPEFVAFLNAMPQTEVAFHGLHHIHKGVRIPVEFQEQDRGQCRAMLAEAKSIFEQAGLRYSPGLQPPGWNLPDALCEACSDVGLRWVASARDILTPITPDATTAMSGLKGVSLIYPQRVNQRGLIHFTSNFQATSPIERAFEILDAGGVLAIKGHIVKNAMGHVALDGIDAVYMSLLDLLCRELDRRYGESLWWTTMGEIAAYMDGMKV